MNGKKKIFGFTKNIKKKLYKHVVEHFSKFWDLNGRKL